MLTWTVIKAKPRDLAIIMDLIAEQYGLLCPLDLYISTNGITQVQISPVGQLRATMGVAGLVC